MNTPQLEKYILEYVWLDGNGQLRSKMKTWFRSSNETLKNDIPVWNYDGSSTGQATRKNSEILLIPKVIFKNPLFTLNLNLEKSMSYLVWCQVTTPDGYSVKGDNFHVAEKIFKRYKDQIPWYGLEQEFFLVPVCTGKFDVLDYEKQVDSHYCGTGDVDYVERIIMAKFYKACLSIDLNISGINAEVAPHQWEFQIGPSVGINASCEMYIARYLLERISTDHNYYVNYHPKPYKGDINGSGCHTNFSTKSMREEGGMDVIKNAINKLSKKHDEHMEVYGKDNDKRMTGDHESSVFSEFTWGIASRGTSIRIPRQVSIDGKGYFEDRRPASNCDPYLVTSKILETVMEGE